MTSGDHWYAAEVEVSQRAIEAAEFAFNSLDTMGTAVEGLQRTRESGSIVAGYFVEQPDRDVIEAALLFARDAYGLREDEIVGLVIRRVENEDWLAEWKKHWRPTYIGRFVVAPPWERVEVPRSKAVIYIEPNMAFGTGTHPTTKLCLQAIEACIGPGDSFADVGTGTGILAIAAAKIAQANGWPRARIVGCDTDAGAITIARENALLNEVPEIEYFAGSTDTIEAEFDVVAANLTARVILELLPNLLAITRKRLILSGILVEQRRTIRDALGSARISETADGEWAAIVVEQEAG
jgi:ribosomal protein L11 methyltransferase